MRRGPGLLFLASGLGALLLLAGLYLRQAPLRAGLDLDAQHHIAAVRELAKGEFPPRHNLVAGHLPQGHYGPYLVCLGWLARKSGAPPLTVLYAAGILNLALFVLLVRRAAERLSGEGAGRWAVLATLLLWGPWPRPVPTWPARGWPGSTSLAEAQNFFYPQQAGLVLLLLALLLLLPRDAAPRPRASMSRWLAALLVSAALVASHPLSGLALVPLLAALVLAESLRRESSGARLGLLLGLPAAALLLASLWPCYPVLGLLQAAAAPGVALDPGPEPLAGAPAAAAPPGAGAALHWPSLPLGEVLGPSLVGLVGFVWLLRRGRPFLALWFAANLALAALPWLPLRHRFVFFAALPLQLAACGVLERGWRSGRPGRIAALLLLGAGAVSVGQRLHWLLEREVPELGFVSRFTPQDAVVLSDQTTSNGVAGLAGRKVVAPQNPDLFLVASGGWQRVLDARRFFSRQASQEERAAILRRWGVTHVLLDRLRPASPETLPYPLLHEQGGYRLYSSGSSTRPGPASE